MLINKNYFLVQVFSNIKKIKEYLKIIYKTLSFIISKDKLNTLILAIIVVVQGILPSQTILITKYIIDSIEKRNTSNTIYFILIWFTLNLLSNAIFPIISFVQSNITDRFSLIVGKALMEKSISFKQIKVYDYQIFYDNFELLKNESQYRPTNFLLNNIGVFRELMVTISCIVVAISILDNMITFLISTICILNFIIYSRVHSKTWEESIIKGKVARKLNYYISLTIDPKYSKEIRIFNFGTDLIFRYTELFENLLTKLKKTRFNQITWAIIPQLLSAAIYFISCYFIINLIISQKFEISIFIIFFQMLNQLNSSVSSLGYQLGHLLTHIKFFDIFFKFLENNDSESDYVTHYHEASIQLTDINITDIKSIEFKNVSFSYPNTEVAVFTDFNLKINKGEKIGLIGLNGSGKSTLIKLICGLYKPSSGEILVNNVLLNQVNIEKYWNLITIIFQDYCCYNFTIGENISFFKKKSILKQLKFATSFSNILDMINNFNNKFDEQIGKAFGGKELSTGQQQRVAIARSVFKDGKLLILDEPTASIDPKNEKIIFKNYFDFFSNQTIILVTHKMNLLQHLDRIIIMDKGKIIGDGKHSELIIRCSQYAEFYKSYIY